MFSYVRGDRIWRFSGRSEETIRVSGNLRANDSEMLRDAAIGGTGLILVPSWLVAADIQAGRLRAILTDWEANLGSHGVAIHAVYLPNRRSSKRVRAFIDFLAARFGSPPYWDRVTGSDAS